MDLSSFTKQDKTIYIKTFEGIRNVVIFDKEHPSTSNIIEPKGDLISLEIMNRYAFMYLRSPDERGEKYKKTISIFLENDIEELLIIKANLIIIIKKT